MALMVNGKKVVGYALGGTEFYSIGEHAKASSMLSCDFHSSSDPTSYSVSVDLSQSLSSDSVLTVKDLIDKGEKIRLILSFYNKSNPPSSSSLASGIVDLSKPDSNSHFNFHWIDGATSTNTYCCSDSSTFTVYSDAIGAYFSGDYDTGHMTILYSDES